MGKLHYIRHYQSVKEKALTWLRKRRFHRANEFNEQKIYEHAFQIQFTISVMKEERFPRMINS